MSYEHCVETYRRLREEHRGDPEMMELVERFGHEIAIVRVSEEMAAMNLAQMVIEKAARLSRS